MISQYESAVNTALPLPLTARCDPSLDTLLVGGSLVMPTQPPDVPQAMA
jgi:hypothetical protein